MKAEFGTINLSFNKKNAEARLLSKCDIDQQLLARDVHNIAERALTLTREVQRHAAVPDAQVTNVQKVEPVRQSWIHDMKFLASG